MKRTLKWLGIAAGGVLLLAVLALAAIMAMGGSKFNGRLWARGAAARRSCFPIGMEGTSR
jgi:hypothetical protein